MEITKFQNTKAPERFELRDFNIYECEICDKTIYSSKFLIIIPKITPICSVKCKFKQIYYFLSKYPTNDLIQLQKLLNIGEIRPFSRNKLLFRVTQKYFHKLNSEDKIKPTHTQNRFEKLMRIE